MYYILYLYCAVYYITHIYIYILSCIVYMYMYYVFLPMTSRFPISPFTGRYSSPTAVRCALLGRCDSVVIGYRHDVPLIGNGTMSFLLMDSPSFFCPEKHQGSLEGFYNLWKSMVHENNDWVLYDPMYIHVCTTYIRFRCLKIIQQFQFQLCIKSMPTPPKIMRIICPISVIIVSKDLDLERVSSAWLGSAEQGTNNKEWVLEPAKRNVPHQNWQPKFDS